MIYCPKCGQSRMSSPTYCPGDGSCGIVGCFGGEHLTSRCSCGYTERSQTHDVKQASPPPFPPGRVVFGSDRPEVLGSAVILRDGKFVEVGGDAPESERARLAEVVRCARALLSALTTRTP